MAPKSSRSPNDETTANSIYGRMVSPNSSRWLCWILAPSSQKPIRVTNPHHLARQISVTFKFLPTEVGSSQKSHSHLLKSRKYILNQNQFRQVKSKRLEISHVGKGGWPCIHGRLTTSMPSSESIFTLVEPFFCGLQVLALVPFSPGSKIPSVSSRHKSEIFSCVVYMKRHDAIRAVCRFSVLQPSPINVHPSRVSTKTRSDLIVL
ncbi:hypothetical protein TNIN_281041 [Trichonephila inaurata madagascariensis]|uniref:Uncharacterized protein n=1 Tax=Trichonephila inaurata madagascariensis TaxID=2747483 RepID=A0A8X6XP46_9ARAC|nr:hypothetical protein TNIN_281041 [Trichonephila inaurata madagascariensis]